MFSRHTLQKQHTPTNEEYQTSKKFTKILIVTYLLDNLIQITNGVKMLKFIQVINNEISSIDILKKIFDHMKYDTKHPSLLCFGGIPRDLILYFKKLNCDFDPNISAYDNYKLFTKNIILNKSYDYSINDIDLLELPESNLYNTEAVIINLLEKLSKRNVLCGFFTNFQYWRYNSSYNCQCLNRSIKNVRNIEIIITFANFDYIFSFKIDLGKISIFQDFMIYIQHSSDSLLMTLSENYFKNIKKKTFIDKYHILSLKNFSFTDWYDDSFSLLKSNLKNCGPIPIVFNHMELNFKLSSNKFYIYYKRIFMYWKNLYFRNYQKCLRGYKLFGCEEIEEHFCILQRGKQKYCLIFYLIG